MAVTARTCSTCLYFGKPGLTFNWATWRDEVKGECHQSPPESDGKWPLLLATDGCGAWKAKEAK